MIIVMILLMIIVMILLMIIVMILLMIMEEAKQRDTQRGEIAAPTL